MALFGRLPDGEHAAQREALAWDGAALLAGLARNLYEIRTALLEPPKK